VPNLLREKFKSKWISYVSYSLHMKNCLKISKVIRPRSLAIKAAKCPNWVEASYQIDGSIK
jgi:hypothetical protein